MNSMQQIKDIPPRDSLVALAGDQREMACDGNSPLPAIDTK